MVRQPVQRCIKEHDRSHSKIIELGLIAKKPNQKSKHENSKVCCQYQKTKSELHQNCVLRFYNASLDLPNESTKQYSLNISRQSLSI